MSAQEYYTLEAARLQRENAELLAYKAAADEALSYTLETTQDERAKELSLRALNVGAHGAGQEDTVKTHGIKQARCSNKDLDLLRAYFENVETHIEECDDSTLGAWLRNTWDRGAGRHWLRLISGYETLVDNACDKSLPYLEWKPALKSLTKRVHEIAGYANLCYTLDTQSHDAHYAYIEKILLDLMKDLPG